MYNPQLADCVGLVQYQNRITLKVAKPMFWKEKIDQLKKHYPPTAFRDPFRDGPSIIEKIYTRLLRGTGWQFYNAYDRTALMQTPLSVRHCSLNDFVRTELTGLSETERYFLLLIDIPRGPSFAVYDCQLAVMMNLIQSASRGPELVQEFYIAQKKYAWLHYIRIDRTKQEVEIHVQTAGGKTPGGGIHGPM